MAGIQQPQYTLEERVFMVLKYCETFSIAETLRLFILQFPHARVPNRKTITRNYNKYLEFGQSGNRNTGNSGRRRTARTQANIARVRQALQNDPTISARRNPIAQLTPSSFNRITRIDLSWHPYRIQRRNALLPGDLPRRMDYCQWLTNRPNRFLRDVIIGDEANFPMNGNVNTHNVRCYAPKNNPPRHFTYDIPVSREKLVVWAGMMGDGALVGPVFIDGNMNAAKYREVINQTIVPHLLANGRYQVNANGSIRRVWYFQDGAPCHRERGVHQILEDLFPRRVVGLGHAVEWPPRSPDLTPLDFFLWGYLKYKVYQTPPTSLLDLRRRVVREFNALRRTRMPRRAINTMLTRAQRCIVLGGRHVEGRAGR